MFGLNMDFTRNHLKSYRYQSVMLLKSQLLFGSHTQSTDDQSLRPTNLLTLSKVSSSTHCSSVEA